MTNLLYANMFDDCEVPIKKLALKYNLEDTVPRAILLFDYSPDPNELKQLYLKENPEASDVYVITIKFLPPDVFEIIKSENNYANNMFVLLLAW